MMTLSSRSCFNNIPAWWMIGFLLLVRVATAAPVVVIDQDRFRSDLAAYVDVLEDTQANLTLEQVQSDNYIHQFAPASMSELYFGYTRSAYWLRFTVDNKLPRAQPLILEVTPADIDFIDVYELDSRLHKVVSHKQSGSSVSFGARDYNHPLYYFDLNLQGQSSMTYFVRLQSAKTINAHLHLATPRQHFYYSGMRDWWQGYLLSALVTLGVLHLGLAFLFRYKGFAYCGLTMLSMAILQASWNGYFLQFMQPDAVLLDRQLAISVYTAAAFGFLFTRSYLNLHERSRLSHRILTVLIVISLMGIPCSWLFQPQINSLIMGLITVPATFIVFAIAIYRFFEGDELARYFLLVRTVTIVMTLMVVFADQGLLVENFSITWGLAAAYIIEGLVFAFVMIRHQYRKKMTREIAPTLSVAASQSQVPVSAFCHELRTPISGVMGMTELLMDTPLTEQQRVQAETIHNSGKTLLDVVNRMSDLALLESGELELNETVFDLMSLVEACIEDARNISERRNIELIYQLDEQAASLVKGDEEKLRQIVNNLIQYGIRQLDAGEILLSVKPTQLDRFVFEIRAGKHTLPHDLPMLSDVSRKQSSADSLSLTIARRFLALLGSELVLHARSDGGVQASFEVTLKVQRRDALPDTDNLWLRGRRLLVVDDNETCCRIVQQQASAWGMEVVAATSGKEALAVLRNQATLGGFFDLLLIDYDMPGMNGLELIARIEQEQESLHTQNALVLVLTGVSKMPRHLAASHSIHRVLYKPLSGKSLKLALTEALQQAIGKTGV